jgi:hypothetical protein
VGHFSKNARSGAPPSYFVSAFKGKARALLSARLTGEV